MNCDFLHLVRSQVLNLEGSHKVTTVFLPHCLFTLLPKYWTAKIVRPLVMCSACRHSTHSSRKSEDITSQLTIGVAEAARRRRKKISGNHKLPTFPFYKIVFAAVPF